MNGADTDTDTPHNCDTNDNAYNNPGVCQYRTIDRSGYWWPQCKHRWYESYRSDGSNLWCTLATAPLSFRALIHKHSNYK